MDLPIRTRLKRWRKAIGVSQASLGKAADATGSAICQIERGAAQPSVALLQALVVKGLGQRMSDFYDDAALEAAERAALRRARKAS